MSNTTNRSKLLYHLLLVFLLLITLFCHQTKAYIKSKNLYSFGYIYYSGFPTSITLDTNTPIENNLLPKYLFNGTDSWRLITGNETTNTSVKLQQIVTGVTTMFYILEHFNTDTNTSLGQRILVSGSNMNGQGALIKPPYIMSAPELLYIYTKDGESFNPFSPSNRILQMACLYSCLIVSSDGHVRYHYGLLSGNGFWPILFSAASYNDPDNGQLLTGVKFVQAAIGGYYGCETMFAITNYGHVFSSGCHNFGLRGTSISYPSSSVQLVPSLRNITTISVGYLDEQGPAGKTAAGAIDVNGVLWTWGSNFNGMLGWNSTVNVSETAQPVTLISGQVTQFSYGFSHGIAMRSNGDVLCFGGNDKQQCDYQSGDASIMVPTKIDSVTNSQYCVAKESMSFCILVDGTVRSWGASLNSFLNLGHSGAPVFNVVNLGQFITSSIYLSGIHGMAISTTNKISVWGSNANGMLTMGDEFMVRYPRKLSTFAFSNSNVSVVTAKAGNACSFLLSSLGNDSSTNVLEYWGACNYGIGFSVSAYTPTQAPTPLTSKKIIDIDMKEEFAVALVENGDVYAWGRGDSYAFGSPSSTNSNPILIYSNVKLMTAASSNTYLLLQNGTLMGIGDNTYDELGITGPASISSFVTLNTSVIDSNNEVIVDIKGGTQTLYVLTNKGNVYGMGLNTGSSKYLSSSSTTKYSYFIRINVNVKVRKIFVGYLSSIILVSTSGVPYYFNGAPTKLLLPTSDSYLIEAFMYASRYYFITKKGNVYTAGDNDYYQTSYRNGFSPLITSPTLYQTKDDFDGIPYKGLAGNQVAGIITREEYTCYGVNSTDVSVCSSNGYCSGPDSCTCDEGFSGLTCANFTCDSISSWNSSVCSGRGICTGVDTCTNCTNSNGKYCQYLNCYGIYSSSSLVCSGNGYCTSYNNCQCKPGFYGTKCEYRSCFGGSALNGVLPRQTVSDVFCKNINKLLK